MNYKFECGSDKVKLVMLGTGNALVTECYNTCFVIDDNRELFLVDGGGGNAILHQVSNPHLKWGLLTLEKIEIVGI